ncbi:MAG TPA: HNH endonuclease signature motif containing protein, partial [Mycobacteriales bacterium]|nr:HNH endonuclease signature motif containing protein [Mycobacteriales bacterium]
LYRWIIAAIRAALPPALGGSSPDILAAGRSIRLVPPHIRRALNVRDQGCVHPGCDRAPARCHAHHIQHWLHGGPTDLDNLVLACAYHHQHWHREHLKPVRQPDGNWQIHPDPHAAAGHHHGHDRGRHAA